MRKGIPGKQCAYPNCEQRPYGPRAIRCPRHHEEHARKRNTESTRKSREKALANGKCTICHTRDASPGLRTCARCREMRRPENAVRNMRRVEPRRDLGREVVRKVHEELGQMLRVPTDAWDAYRVRALGHFLASFYLYQRDNKKLPHLTYMGNKHSAVRKLHEELRSK